MVRIKYCLFGYREVRIDGDTAAFITAMIRAKIPFEAIADGKILLPERHLDAFKALFDGKKYAMSDMLGIRGRFFGMKHKAALFSAVFFGFILVFLSRALVWDVRISGNESLPDSVILDSLEECGLSVGKSWFSAKLSDIEYEVLEKCDGISWININRVGTVAFVRVIEGKNTVTDVGESAGYANIVADRDCVIEEITVKSGTAVVKVGDAVRRGDLLIMGIENNELGRLVRAEGSVIGRAYDTVRTELSRERTERVRKSEEKLSVNIKIFDFSLNIFKKYGNSDSECDIIESKRRITLFGKYKLPIEIETKSAVLYEYESKSYNDSELASVCSARHRQLLKNRLFGKDLLKISTVCAFEDGGYAITSEIVYSREVGVTARMGEE